MGLGQQKVTGTLIHDNRQREYLLYVPAIYNGQYPVPLLFNFHGYTSNADDQMWYGDFRPIADTAGFLIAHPMGTRDDSGVTHFNVGWGGSNVDDVGFAEALIEHIAASYNIDLTRVYSTGMSNGGFMSYQLACQLSDKIAAIASVAGSMSPATFNNCDPQHPLPVLQIHGTSDVVVPYEGTDFSKAINEVINYWIEYNNCDPTAVTLEVPNASLTDLSTVDHLIYESGDQGVSIELFKIAGGGHTWPGTGLVIPGTNYDIDASAEIWRFFSKYDINGKIKPATTAVQDTEDPVLRVFPNPTTTEITIHSDLRAPVKYQVLTLAGRELLSGRVGPGTHALQLTGIPAGFYLLKVEQRIFKIVKN